MIQRVCSDCGEKFSDVASIGPFSTNGLKYSCGKCRIKQRNKVKLDWLKKFRQYRTKEERLAEVESLLFELLNPQSRG
jgi:hypothetical protein